MHAADLAPVRRSGTGVLLVGLALAAGLGLTYVPWWTTGALVGAAILAVCLLRPLAVVAVMLAIGVVDLSILTGGFKSLSAPDGGLDMNGLRLIGVTVGLGLAVLVDPRMREEALGRHGRYYLLFLAYAAATIPFSVSTVDGLRQWFKLAYLFLVFITVLSLPRSRAELERVADYVLVGAAVVGAVLNPLMIAFGAYVVDHGRIRFTLLAAHENPESFYFLVILLMALMRYARRHQGRYLLLAGVCAVWVILGVARIAFAAGMVSLLVLGVGGAVVARNYRVLGGVLVMGLLLSFALVPAVLQRTLGYVPSPGELVGLFTHPLWLVTHLNMEGREIYWPVVFSLFLSHPIMGTGLGSSRGVLLAHFPAAWSGAVHNEYLRLLSETGIIGLGLFAFAVSAWCWAAARVASIPDRLVREFALPAVAATFVWGITAITDNALDYYAQYAQHVVFLLAGALLAARFARADAATAEAVGDDVADSAAVPEPTTP